MPKTILISRTDNIGDVVLTLPMAGIIKKYFPDILIGFLGRAYTKDIIENCVYVDEFIDVNDFLNQSVSICGKRIEAIIHVLPSPILAKRAYFLAIPQRIGTTNRFYHWLFCNKLIRLSRKKSDLHEAQLNLKLLSFLSIHQQFSFPEIYSSYGFGASQALPENILKKINKNKFNVIFHPKSQGNGKEWPLEHYIELAKLLDKNKFKVFITGTKQEERKLEILFNEIDDLVINMCGKLSLNEFVSFISICDGLVASGTGPIHLAAALGINALGIFPSIRPIHPGRWQPIGQHAYTFYSETECNLCKGQIFCACMKNIEPNVITKKLEELYLLKFPA
ncbi:glycosyltransferase family 9 protein [Hydrotalea flava]|uniref:glycosyltransferase family 9 protein n=1 Tax=Hydrotalea flava TaxID=714549 RepID=UPI0020A4CA8A|nr:glycosyltransferase family 9 protein [Hydrotalea flava]